MKLSITHLRSIRKGTKLIKTFHDVVLHPHKITLPHEQLHGGLGRTYIKASYCSRTSTVLHHKVSLIVSSMYCWHKGWAVEDPNTGPHI